MAERISKSEALTILSRDLNYYAQKEFLKFQGIEKPEDGNLDVNPIFVLEKSEED